MGDWIQKEGCPEDVGVLDSDRLEKLCAGECYYPGDRRHKIDRIEIVRVRPQTFPGEPVEQLIEDPWRTIQCEDSSQGCVVRFSDESFSEEQRDAVYYVRALQEASDDFTAV